MLDSRAWLYSTGKMNSTGKNIGIVHGSLLMLKVLLQRYAKMCRTVILRSALFGRSHFLEPGRLPNNLLTHVAKGQQ